MKIYNIGDKVWYAQRKTEEKTVKCPECFGKKYLTVILGDDSKVTIDCAGCASGYNPPLGYIFYWEQYSDVSLVTINRVEINTDYVEYKFCGNYIAKDTDIFPTKELAEIRAKELAEEHNREELEKIYRKEKHNHSWAWHVHYYRDMIRRAERDIERAREKLDFAKTKVKKT